ncbi:Sodium/hydrogen exchanger family-domain-containing protein [Scleroderma yunnanense]
MLSLLVKEMLYINEVVLGTGFGVLIGPYAANIFNPRSWGTEENRITLEVMRIVLATGLFAVGVELPCAYMWEHVKSLLVMVIPTMAFGWIVVAGTLRFLFPVLDMISALCIAACLTPTDPVTCAAITRGKFAAKHVPVQIRSILSAESAANDGLAYPFLSLSLYLTVEASTRTAIEKWFLIGWLYQVVFGTAIGAILGLIFSKLMKQSHRKGFIDRESYIAQYLALAIFTIGVASTLGADDLLAAFAAGSAISWDGHFNVQTEGDAFASVIDYVMNCGCFVYIGAWLPFSSYDTPELGITPWRLVLLLVLILFLRRIPPLLLLYKFIPEISSWKEALFAGHFGPMGVSAVFVSALALTRLPDVADPPVDQPQLLAAMIQPVVSFVVLGSIVIHGLSIPFFNLGREMHSRTTSVSFTWTNRTTRTVPDWVLWARRPESVAVTPSATDTIVTDAERGLVANNDHSAHDHAVQDRTQTEAVLGTSERGVVQGVTTLIANDPSSTDEHDKAKTEIETSSPSVDSQMKTVRFPFTE